MGERFAGEATIEERMPAILQQAQNPINIEKAFNELIDGQYGLGDVAGAVSVVLETQTVGMSSNSFVKINDQKSQYQQEEKR